jgi:hypothetical protein
MSSSSGPTRSSSKSSSDTKSDAKTDEAIELPEYEEALERGHLGVRVDDRDDSEYTVEGVIKRAKDSGPDITQETKVKDGMSS